MSNLAWLIFSGPLTKPRRFRWAGEDTFTRHSRPNPKRKARTRGQRQATTQTLNLRAMSKGYRTSVKPPGANHETGNPFEELGYETNCWNSRDLVWRDPGVGPDNYATDD